MRIKTYKKMMVLGKRLFNQEQVRFNGLIKFAYLNNDETGEAIFYSPDKTTSDRIRECLALEFMVPQLGER